MEISQENIKVIITASGAVFVGQELDIKPGINKVKLTFPFRFMLDQKSGISTVAAPLYREDWIVIDMNGAIECALNPTVEELYRKYAEQVFGSGLILPEEKKIIV